MSDKNKIAKKVAKKAAKVAVYAATRNLYFHLLLAVTSLLENSSVDEVYLLIEDDELPYKLPSNVYCINVSNQDFFDINGPNYNSHWTYMTMMKIAIPSMLPWIDRVLYLDVDTIVDDNIDGIWDIDTHNNYFCAVKEIHKSTPQRLYFNAGVLLIDCKEIREDGIGFEMMHSLNTKKYNFPDQDCINEFCAGKILELPPYYNVNAFTEQTDSPKIYHFASESDWSRRPVYMKYLKKYVNMTAGVTDG